MIIKHDIPIYSICWLSHAKGGKIGTFYEPESKQELEELCLKLYKEGQEFDLIGHTSNIYFLPNYSVDIMVSTRKVRNVMFTDSRIIADCGTSVKSLAKKMVTEGVKGFEGLIDLPGTVAASVYGNASCYDCSINSMLVSVELLKENGEIVTLKPEDLKLTRRSSVLKRGELEGIILSVTLRKEKGDKDAIKQKSEANHKHRKATQPPSKDNLGSIYSKSTGWSKGSRFPRMIANVYCAILLLTGTKRTQLKKKKKDIILRLLGAGDLCPYVYGWNRFLWKDDKSHELFWKFHKIHQKVFNKSDFEIEIKGERKPEL